MNPLTNKVLLIGNLGKDPEVADYESGKKRAKVSIATSDFYLNAEGEKVTQTEWHNLVGWGRTAELMEKVLKKGNKVAVEGKLTSRSYEDKEGQTRYITEIIVNDFLNLTPKDPDA
jgi:single-strand DNA-binding protein